MKFVPKTQEQLDSQSLDWPLLPDGIYDFSVNEADETISEKGNDMIKLKLNVYNIDGRPYIITDFLLEAMAFKLNHFCKAFDLFKYYEKGELEAYMCIGKTGQVKIGTQKGKPNPDGGMYKDRNIIKDYVVNEQATKSEQKPKEEYSYERKTKSHATTDGLEDEDIPF